MSSPPTSFIHLHVHSHYSFLEGVVSPADLVKAAAANSMSALALTDHNVLTGAIEFYDACLSASIRPILGLELTTSTPFGVDTLTLLAMNMNGWGNICRMSSALQTDPKHNPSRGLPLDIVSQHSSDLICLVGGTIIGRELNDVAAQYLQQLKTSFADRLYIELRQHTEEDKPPVSRLATLATKLSLPIVAAHNIFYLTADQADLQQTLTAIRLNKPRHDLSPDEIAPPDSRFLSASEMLSRFNDHPAALAATHEIAERCQLRLPLGVQHYPEITLPDGLTAIEVLRQKSFDGAKRFYGSVTPEIETRLNHELTVIGEKGYAPLFLIMEEILGYARKTGVPTASRGSASSSLVAHCLGVTTPDPIRLNLYFERFLNPARSTPPDIDTDLCSRRRDRVIQHVYEQYGEDRVAMVCTINRFRERSAMREVAKAYGLAPKEVTALTDLMPYRWYGPPNKQATSPFAEVAQHYTSPTHQRIFRDAQAILGLPRHLSIHPGGVVITPGAMTDLVPTLLSTKGIVITQFDLDSIERMGLVKIDLLGIRGLTVLGDVAETISRQQSSAKRSSTLDILDSIPLDDPLTKESVRAGRTIGCFQIESPGMRATLKEINASTVDDIMVALALYRPGPLTGGLKDSFVRRHLKQESVQHLHPALAPLLDDTYGVILYQEQVLRIAHDLAGLSLAEADLLRRAMSHFDPGKQMQTLKEKFSDGAYKHNDVPPHIAERVWELMAAFAGYGFPKAHAASYALVAWRAAWCKVHHPAEFMAAVLANWGGYYSQRVYLTEARRMGLAVRPPHINYSQRQFTVRYIDDKPNLFMGLDQVHELTRNTQQRITRERPFHSLNDFLSKVDPRSQEVKYLIQVGALEGLGTIPSLLRQIEKGGWQRGQIALFEMNDTTGGDWTLEEKVQAQEELLGASIVAHPLELMSAKISETGALTTVAAAGRVGQRVRVAGMRQIWRRTSTTRGDYIYFMSLEDLEGMLDVVIFGDVYRRFKSALTDSGPYVIEGMVEFDVTRSEPLLRAEKIWKVEH